LDVQAYNIPLTGLGIYMGNDYSSAIGSWAGSIIIMTTSTGPSSSPTAKPSSPSSDPSTLPTTLSPTENPTLSPTKNLTLSPFPLSSLIVDLATLGTISACNYIQIPFSEAGSILQSITFSGVSQSKLCTCIIIDYY